jgi:hypothetical protein
MLLHFSFVLHHKWDGGSDVFRDNDRSNSVSLSLSGVSFMSGNNAQGGTMSSVETHPLVSLVTFSKFPFSDSIKTIRNERIVHDSSRFSSAIDLFSFLSPFPGTGAHVRWGFGGDDVFCGWYYYAHGSGSDAMRRVKFGERDREAVVETVLSASGVVKRSKEGK